MGGDHAPGSVVEGSLLAAADGVPVVLVGDRDALLPLLPRTNPPPVIHAPDHIGMADAPTAVRRHEDSSLSVALRLLRDGQASSVVSCGNTGALLVGAVLLVGVLDGVERPAIATVLPRSDGGRLVLLDAGANVDCRPEMLVCFAELGVAYAEVIGMPTPRVGLLANGEEESKGNMQVRATLPLLRASGLRVVGNVEPTAAMGGACEVLVTDGFVGNILLKAAEGAVGTVGTILREEIQRRATGRLGAWLLSAAFDRFRARVAWDAHGGAVLVGLRGVVVVGHGRANAPAVAAAVRLAHAASQAGLVDAVSRRLSAASESR
jgi:glycerol-3-phosphate acyltransferase PlsX